MQSEPGHVLIGPMEPLAILAQVECDVIILQETILPAYLSIPIRKGSPYADYLNKKYILLGQNIKTNNTLPLESLNSFSLDSLTNGQKTT